MQIDDISITRLFPGWVLSIESGGYKFTGNFDNLLGFMHAVGDAVKYFGQAHGLLERKANGEYVSKVKR